MHVAYIVCGHSRMGSFSIMFSHGHLCCTMAAITMHDRHASEHTHSHSHTHTHTHTHTHAHTYIHTVTFTHTRTRKACK